MVFFLSGLIFLIFLILLTKYIVSVEGKKIQRNINYLISIVAFIAGIILLFRGIYHISGPLLLTSLWILRAKRIYDLFFKNRNNFNNNAKVTSKDEAYKILGLDFDATKDDIIIAHKELIRKNHPDKGGSDYLSSKINEARDILLKNIGRK
ncbi:MAG: DnaJ domain-containing protein [Pseudomonadota bacterium]|nr:DnaJ domain-containing protein [Pseudomonadota bacterium]